MKKLIIASVFILVAALASAQDSCYVYTHAKWAMRDWKGNWSAKIQLNEEAEFVDILDKDGNVLSFNNFIHALNYLSMQGWELVEMFYGKNSGQTDSHDVQAALIRKKMPIEEAKKYATPKQN